MWIIYIVYIYIGRHSFNRHQYIHTHIYTQKKTHAHFLFFIIFVIIYYNQQCLSMVPLCFYFHQQLQHHPYDNHHHLHTHLIYKNTDTDDYDHKHIHTQKHRRHIRNDNNVSMIFNEFSKKKKHWTFLCKLIICSKNP